MSKIISQRKIEANRRNAKKSTGPKTEEGKVRSAMNSIKYGIYSDKYLIKDESYEEFDNYRRKILKCLNPTNPVLFDMATHVVSNGWEYQRCTLLESKILNSKSLRRDAERKENINEPKNITVSWLDSPQLQAHYGALEEYSKNEPTDLAEKDNYWKNFDHKKIQSEIKVKKEESIRIENNSDINEVNENNEPTKGVMEIIIAKNNTGNCGSFKLMAEKNFAGFKKYKGPYSELTISQNRLNDLN
jgi:hypothetical protein